MTYLRFMINFMDLFFAILKILLNPDNCILNPYFQAPSPVKGLKNKKRHPIERMPNLSFNIVY